MSIIAWNKVLVSSTCDGYYDKFPCHAHTADSRHDYCKEHSKLKNQKLVMDVKESCAFEPS